MTRLFLLLNFLVWPLFPNPAHGQLDDFLKGFPNTTSPSVGHSLSMEQMTSGLKEALSVGTANAIRLVGGTDGFLKNDAIKIPLPPKLQSMDNALRLAGFGPQMDELIVKMNRAAEQATPLAKPIFQDAISNLTFEDARTILNGRETAATEYFQGKTRDQLAEAFKPEVQQAMTQVGVTAQYKRLVDQYTSLPFVNPAAFDLNDYVVEKSLDGVFQTLEQEEKKYGPPPVPVLPIC
jgi:hypothetical protein